MSLFCVEVINNLGYPQYPQEIEVPSKMHWKNMDLVYVFSFLTIFGLVYNLMFRYNTNSFYQGRIYSSSGHMKNTSITGGNINSANQFPKRPLDLSHFHRRALREQRRRFINIKEPLITKQKEKEIAVNAVYFSKKANSTLFQGWQKQWDTVTRMIYFLARVCDSMSLANYFA